MYTATRTAVAHNRLLLLASVVAFAALCALLLQHRAAQSMDGGVLAWWGTLCAVSVANVCAWRVSAAALARRRADAEPAEHQFRRRQLLLSAVYVLGCGFRSILPRADVQRIGLFDSWLSSVLVGRSVATVAELCFMAQWALLLHRISRDAGCRFGVAVAWLIVPLIAVAEVCSWTAVLTTCYLGNAIEESIWALTVTLLLLSCVALWPRCRAVWRPFLAATLVLGVAYVAFMCTVDVPMYVSRFLADEASGREYLSLSQGWRDVGARWSVTFSWEDWRTEVPWMSLYFSVCVWSSIALVHVPRFGGVSGPARVADGVDGDAAQDGAGQQLADAGRAESVAAQVE
jgi:hypothetical protein